MPFESDPSLPSGPLTEQWWTARLRRPSRAALILDVSDTGASGWLEVRRFALELIRELGRGGVAEVGFLGSEEVYPADGFAESGETWFAANRGRARLLTPAFGRLKSAAGVTPVVVAAGPIHDLPD